MEVTVVQSPAVGSDGTVYIGTGVTFTSSISDGMYAIRPDGTLKWKLNMGRPVHSSVALDREDNLYFLAGNAAGDPNDAVVISLDSSGNPRWTSEAVGWQAPNPFTGFTPAIAADGTIYACGRFSLYALDPNGKTKWKYDFPQVDNTTSSGGGQPMGNHRSAPTIAKDGTIYVNTAIGSYGQTEVKGGLFAITPDGNLRWRTYGFGGYATPVIDKNGTIYSAVGCYWVSGATDAADVAKECRLLAINPDGTLKWSVVTQLWIQSSPSIGADGTLYMGTTHHPLDIPAWFYAITPEGQIKWKYDTYNDVKDLPPAQINPPDIYNSPAVDSNGIIYFGNEIGLLYAMSPDGRVEWMDNDIWSLHDQGPALAGDGTLYVATHSIQGLIAFNTGSRGLADSPWPKFRRNNANTGNAGTPRQYMLTIAAGPGGTTNPAPGTYTYDEGTSVSITATANSGYRFGGWSGDASGTANTVTITMNGNKTVTANFIRRYTLTIIAGTGGTTNPVPGDHLEDAGSVVFITALPGTNYRFLSWSGSATGTTNPISITIDSDKTVTANFQRIIYPPSNAAGQKILNRSLSQAEYINVLTWSPNANNVNITGYKIYLVTGTQKTEIATVTEDKTSYTYWHRKVSKNTEYTYQIVAVNSEPREGDPAYITIRPS